MAVFKRVLADAFDLGLLAVVILFLYGMFYAFGSALAEVQSSYFFTILASPDPLLAMRSAFYDALSALSDPLVLLSVLIYGVLMTYLSLVVIGWIAKKRVGYPENPFKRAVDVLIPFIILSIIVFAPVSVFFTLMLYFSYSISLLTVMFALFLIFLLVYTPVVAPSMAALVIDADTVSKALRDGVLVGRRRWIRIILYMLAVSIVTTLLLYIFDFIALRAPWASDFLLVLYQAISFVLSLSVITEVYIADAHGE
ncbi:MAG: hypothetical protein PWP76_166 [Candidatus Diapherotrites archaeon]|nr:hypothetical protein [Candidatus Diapherotrites archaeon]MDN5366600.1 hypothetical protein [Candidatus Diapherotrites archaeon]